MHKIMYQVVTAPNKEELMSNVIEYLSDGWELVGGYSAVFAELKDGTQVFECYQAIKKETISTAVIGASSSSPIHTMEKK